MAFRRSFAFPKSLGFLLLGAWLIATGAVPLLGLSSVFLSMALNILAIVAGVLLLFEARR
jgi:hypothetical protein